MSIASNTPTTTLIKEYLQLRKQAFELLVKPLVEKING